MPDDDFRPELLASYFTLAGDIIPFANDEPARFSLESRAQTAANAGYAGMGVEGRDLRHLVDRLGYTEIRTVLSDYGIRHVELEVLTDWFADGARREVADVQRAQFLEAAGELGVSKIKILGDAEGGLDWSVQRDDWSIDQQSRELRALAKQAAQSGTAITIELVPGTGISDLETARAVIEGAGEANAGLLVDIWHLDRSQIPYEDIIALPKGLINAVEIDDARKQVVGSLFDDTIRNRKLPGEGELDVPRFLTAVLESGYRGYFGVEMVSDEHRASSLEQAARRSFDTTMAQFAECQKKTAIPAHGREA